MLKSLEKEIRYFEDIRLREAIPDINKLKPLYEIYFRLREGGTYEK